MQQKDQNLQNNQNLESQSQTVRILKYCILCYIGYEGINNFSSWLFDWYYKLPGWYWYKHYRAFGYRTRLFNNRFYFDFYMRTWLSILFALSLVPAFKDPSSGMLNMTEELKKIKDNCLSFYTLCCLCFMFVPNVDLNICLGNNFYLVIGFRDIILSYFFVRFVNVSFLLYKSTKKETTQQIDSQFKNFSNFNVDE